MRQIKVFGLLLSLVLIASLAIPSVVVAQQTTVEVNSGNTIQLAPGGTADNIPLAIKNIPESGVGAFTFDLSWNPSVVHVESVTGATIAGFSITPGTPDNTEGKVTIAGFMTTTALTGDEVIVATLSISAVGNPGDSTSINVTITALGDPQANDIDATPVGAPVEITGHDVGIALDYNGAVDGIKITRDGTDVVGADESLTIGQSYKIRYKLVNNGSFAETIAVTVKVDDTTLATHNYSLSAGASNTYADTWDTSGLSEGTHTITVTASISNDANPDDNQRTREVTLVSPAPTVAFSAGSYQVSEGGGTATITVNLSQATSQTVTVDYATSDSMAIAGQDYTAATVSYTHLTLPTKA